MEDTLLVGAAQDILLSDVLRDANLKLTQLGLPARDGDLSALEVSGGTEATHNGGCVKENSFLILRFKGGSTSIRITHFETEVVPGYSLITDRFTYSISVWVGAEAIQRIIAGCVAVAIAAITGSKILDWEHKWSNNDLNDPEDFMVSIARHLK